MTTHYMEAAEYCHRLALINRGRLIVLDTPEVVEAALFGRVLHVMVDRGDPGGHAARRALAGAGLPVRRVGRVRPSLEDVFVALVRAAGGTVEG